MVFLTKVTPGIEIGDIRLSSETRYSERNASRHRAKNRGVCMKYMSIQAPYGRSNSLAVVAFPKKPI
ncbi:Uncharacterised protein [Legionella feeleii]|uniref:Uncharacterized protein n=1 Tax=Legionella feeleii TaxID=453 RepID=A0A378IWJ3_9GAMM|nr:Uncharacterised protein [Legionella feeleii]